MRRRITCLSALAAGSVVALTLGAVPAFADTTENEMEAAIEAIQAAPEVDVSAVADTVETDAGVTAEVHELDITVPWDASEGLQLDVDGTPLAIDLPFADVAAEGVESSIPGVIVYDNGNGSSTIPIVREDGGIQITVVIDHADAPHRYDFPLTVPEGARVTMDETGAASTTGQDADEPALWIAPPWATDANGDPVPTRFEVDGSTLTQVVDFTADTAFPVVADPATYVDYTTKEVINIKRLGTVVKWNYLNACTAAKGKSCSVSRTYTLTQTAQTSLNVSFSVIAASIGVTNGQSTQATATCNIAKGPGTVTLYAQAAKTTYQVRTVRRYGVPNAGNSGMKTETKTSGVLTAYKPNGRFTCA